VDKQSHLKEWPSCADECWYFSVSAHPTSQLAPFHSHPGANPGFCRGKWPSIYPLHNLAQIFLVWTKIFSPATSIIPHAHSPVLLLHNSLAPSMYILSKPLSLPQPDLIVCAFSALGWTLWSLIYISVPTLLCPPGSLVHVSFMDFAPCLLDRAPRCSSWNG
jgi:hypothetical protein